MGNKSAKLEHSEITRSDVFNTLPPTLEVLKRPLLNQLDEAIKQTNNLLDLIDEVEQMEPPQDLSKTQKYYIKTFKTNRFVNVIKKYELVRYLTDTYVKIPETSLHSLVYYKKLLEETVSEEEIKNYTFEAKLILKKLPIIRNTKRYNKLQFDLDELYTLIEKYNDLEKPEQTADNMYSIHLLIKKKGKEIIQIMTEPSKEHANLVIDMYKLIYYDKIFKTYLTPVIKTYQTPHVIIE